MLARQISFLAPAFVMSAWATVMLHAFASGHLNRLLSPMFHSYVLIAAILLLALSALYVLLYQPTEEIAPALAPTGTLRQLGRWLVLLIPVVAASILSPAALSSPTLINRGLNGALPMPSMDDASKKLAQEALASDPNQPVPIEVTELITISHSSQQIAQFDGRPVRCVGLYVAQPDNPVKLVRGIMWCCAADIMPVSVELTGNTSGNWKDSQWIEVTGKARFPSTLGHVIPTIEVDSIKPTDEPDEPYLSP